jgi:hypothetical protein
MENEFALEIKRQKVLTEYKSALISAINLILDNIKSQKELAETIIENGSTKMTSEKVKGFEKSIDRYSALKSKIENDVKLSKADYSLLAVACTGASNSVASNAHKLLDSAKQLQNLAKAFMA